MVLIIILYLHLCIIHFHDSYYNYCTCFATVLLTFSQAAKLCDFDTARRLDHTTNDTLIDTYAWMAPEVCACVFMCLAGLLCCTAIL